jgi:glyoxylase-like metal-dependent hydrolase (beta-lactamase superfamily II)
MKQLGIGDITIDAVIERDGPWRRPQDFFPAYDEAVFRHHLPSMAPEVFDSALGMMVITYQTFVVRTPRHTILVDTCTGEHKGHPPPFDFPGKERWRNELFALGIAYDKVDYVFCTHLHIDHTGWNTTLRAAGCRRSRMRNTSFTRGNMRPGRPSTPKAPIRPARYSATTACPSSKPDRRCWSMTITRSTTPSR